MLGVVLLVAAALWWAAATSGDPASAPDEPATSETPPVAAPAAPSAPAAPPAPSKPSPSTPEAPPTGAPTPALQQQAPQLGAAAEDPTDSPVPPPQAQGPVDALKERFKSEPRDSAATVIESRIQAAFRDPAIPGDVLSSVLCHKTICKLEIRWTQANNTPYMLGLSHLLPDLSTDLAYAPAGPVDAYGVMPLDVYWGRKPDAP